MTALAAAFAKAGYDVAADRLANAAWNALRRRGRSVEVALPGFCEVLRGDDALLQALAGAYLKERAADINNQSLSGGSQTRTAQSHDACAAVAQSNESGVGQINGARARSMMPTPLSLKADCNGHLPSASSIDKMPSQSAPIRSVNSQSGFGPQGMRAVAATEPMRALRAMNEDDVGQGDPDAANSQVPASSSPKADREGQNGCAPASPHVPLRSAPTVPPAAVKARLAAAQFAALTVLDTFKVRGGTPIGDLGWSEAKALANLNEREARVLRYVTDHVANAEPGARVRDVVKPEVVERAILLAKEASHAVV